MARAIFTQFESNYCYHLYTYTIPAGTRIRIFNRNPFLECDFNQEEKK